MCSLASGDDDNYSLEAMMAVRAKFWVREVHHTTAGGKVILNAVCRGEDNKKWASATPVGEISMTVLTAALDQFVPGEEFYIDFTPAPKGQEGM